MKKCNLCQQWFKKYPKTKIDELNHVLHEIDEGVFSSPISCYFEEIDREWSCGTVGLIRDLVYEGKERLEGIDYQYCDDQKYATIKIDDVHINDNYIGYALWLTWYKQRGHTDNILILDSEGARKPTEQELLEIYKHYHLKRCKIKEKTE